MAVIALVGLAALFQAAGIDVTRIAGSLPGSQFFGINAAAPGDYRVDVVFDTAKGIIPGQLVKVAGVRVGAVQDVTLTSDFKARVEMAVDSRFAPFRASARCEIRPEGLTAENFIQCDPGSAPARALVASGSTPPTVPVAHTSVPVNLNALFQVWTAPTADRLTILVNELGIGLAARGDDLNAILRRTNPALTHARRVIDILSGERRQLATVVDATDRVASELASRPQRVTDFISQAARLTTTTAAHGDALAAGIHRLPPLLRAAEPTLRRANRFAVGARPLVVALRRSAGPFSTSLTNLRSFAAESDPVLTGLQHTLKGTLPTLKRALPTLDLARRFTTVAQPVAPQLSALFTNLRDRGLIEGALKLFYYLAAGSARFDATSHVLPSEIILNKCVGYSTQPVSGCSAHYYDQPSRSGSSATKQLGGKGSAAVRVIHRGGGQAAGGNHRGSGTPPPSPPSPTPAPGLPPIPGLHLPDLHLPGLPHGGGHGGEHSDNPVGDLLQYLLG